MLGPGAAAIPNVAAWGASGGNASRLTPRRSATVTNAARAAAASSAEPAGAGACAALVLGELPCMAEAHCQFAP